MDQLAGELPRVSCLWRSRKSSHAGPNPDTDSHAYTHADPDADTNAYTHADPNANTDSNSDAHAGPWRNFPDRELPSAPTLCSSPSGRSR